MRTSAILIVLMLIAGCASSADKPGSPPRRPGTDTLCRDDCLGNGGTKEFCEDRCSY